MAKLHEEMSSARTQGLAGAYQNQLGWPGSGISVFSCPFQRIPVKAHTSWARLFGKLLACGIQAVVYQVQRKGRDLSGCLFARTPPTPCVGKCAVEILS